MEVTTLGSGVTADDIRLGLRNRPEVGVTVRVSSSRQGRCRVTDRVTGHRQGALRQPRRLCACALNRKRKSIVHMVPGFTWSFPSLYYWHLT